MIPQITEFLFSILLMIATGVIGYIGGMMKKRISKEIDEDRAIKNGLRALLREKIIEICDRCIDRGYVHIHNLESIDDLYIQYHELGGNGMVTKLVEDTKKLQLR